MKAGRIIAILGLLLLARGQAPAPDLWNPSLEQKQASTATCAFSNPRYSGWCRVSVNLPEGKPAGTACGEVLACLNNVACTKTYCSATETRGGWKLEEIR
jgi:hypothetical protein